jgi:hypothetical protein
MCARFSDRIGITSIPTELSRNNVSPELTNRIWSRIYTMFTSEEMNTAHYVTKRSKATELHLHLWDDFFKKPIDIYDIVNQTVPGKHTVGRVNFIAYVKDWFLSAQWYEKLNFLQYLIDLQVLNWKRLNGLFKAEFSAYRIITGVIVEITDEEEIKEVEASLNIPDQYSHVKRALKDLADRENPAYRNSIKESISAVEAICMKIAGNGSGTLGKVLEKLERTQGLHPSLKAAFSKLYGYTSDAGGIRHALSDNGVEPGQEEARFMLITCSAFVNYLVQKVPVNSIEH